MERQKPTEMQATARLRAALTAPDTLTCEAASALLPAFVEAEQAGVDVDADPAYAALLAHFDTCADCLARYERLADDVAAFADDAAALPASAAPRFFAPARRAEHGVLRVLGGLQRRFDLTLTVPRVVPAAAETAPTPLFDATLDELPGTPRLAVVLAAAPPELRVTVRDAGGTRWQVHLRVGETTYRASTDASGDAILRGFRLADLHAADLDLWCSAIVETP